MHSFQVRRKFIADVTAFGALVVLPSQAKANSTSKANRIPLEDFVTARAIKADARLNKINEMARTVLSSGLTAGTFYPEVWIRDLNTFIEAGLQTCDHQRYRQALKLFLILQGPEGDILDGYVPASGLADRKYRTHRDAPGLFGHKNSVEVDQESSLVQAVHRYVLITGDRAFLTEMIDGKTVIERLDWALTWVMHARWSPKYDLVWAATKIDWGDVQPENNPGDQIDEATHPAIGIYDNAFFVIAIGSLLDLLPASHARRTYWRHVRARTIARLRKHLWRGPSAGFRPHLYLEKGSPFPPDFDEDSIYYFGGTATAFEAGILTRAEIGASYQRMKTLVKIAGAQTVGLTVFPAYPSGLFKNPNVATAYTYQNGGDWDWFGARIVRMLLRYGYAAEAYEALGPMLDRTIAAKGFFEWWTLNNQPRGAGDFRGAAGVLTIAVQELQAWSAKLLG